MASKSNQSQSRWAQPMSDLHILVSKCFPEHRTQTHDVVDITWLAKKLKMSREGFYKYLRANAMPVARVRQLVALPGCRKKFADFTDFLA